MNERHARCRQGAWQSGRECIFSRMAMLKCLEVFTAGKNARKKEPKVGVCACLGRRNTASHAGRVGVSVEGKSVCR